ncbi:MAG: hypothetical protein AAF081_05165 [Actinomycetota bacterium]
MQPRQIVIMLVTLIVIVGAALFVVTWTGGDDEDTAAPTTTLAPSTSSTTSTTSTTTTSTTTTTIPVECSTDPADTETDTVPETTESTTSTSTTTTTTAETGDDVDDEPAAPTTTVLNLGTNDSISTVGLGEVTFGMTVAQAEVAAGTDLINCAPTSACYRVTPARGPEGISFLVTESTIERVDIVSGPLTTRSGIGIGSPEDDIINLFGDQIEILVNDDSSVDLIFVPQDESDAEFRVIFTIRDGVVETFRSGRVPQVTVQDPCAG